MPEPTEYTSALDAETIDTRIRELFVALSGGIFGAIQDVTWRKLAGTPPPTDPDPIKKLQGKAEIEVLEALGYISVACMRAKEATSKEEELTHLEDAMSRANTAIRTLLKYDQPTYVVRQVQRTIQSHYVTLYAGNVPSRHY